MEDETFSANLWTGEMIGRMGAICRVTVATTSAVALLLAGNPREGAAQQPEIRDAVLDSLLRLQFAADAPGAAIVVRHGQTIVHRAGYGVTDLSAKQPITSETPFYIGSVAKPFTATAIVSLIEQGRLRYTDTLGAVLPRLGVHGGVSIAQLLTHTSGIPDYYQFIDWPRFRSIANEGVLAMLREHPAPAFAPGKRFGYSNSGYVLLAEVIASTSGMAVSSYLERELFAKAGMTSATTAAEPPHAPPLRAIGYSRSDSGFSLSDVAGRDLGGGQIFPFVFATVGAGGLFASANDLIAWENALSRGKILSPGALRDMQAPRVATGDSGRVASSEHYGYGWYTAQRSGRTWVWHSGNFAGFAAMLVTVPSAELAVVVLSNVAETDAVEVGTRVMDELLARASRDR